MPIILGNHLDLDTEVLQTHPCGYKGHIGVRGVITPSNLPHITYFYMCSDMSEMDQITGRLTCLDHMASLSLPFMEPNLSTHGDMTLGQA